MDDTAALNAPIWFYAVSTLLPMVIVAGLRQLNLGLGRRQSLSWLNPYLAGAISTLVQLLIGLQANIDLSPAGVLVVSSSVAGLREWLDSARKAGVFMEAVAGLVLLLCVVSSVDAATAERWFKTDALVTGAVVETGLGLELLVEGRRVICPPELEFQCKPLRAGDIIDVEGPDTPIDRDEQDVREMDRICVSRAAQTLPPPSPERR